MEKIFIKPAVAGHIIRHPEKMEHIISQEGEWVVNAMHWQRKLLQGDVVLAQPPEPHETIQKPAVKQKSNSKGDE